MFSRKKLKEKYSIFVSKYPGRAVLMAIVAFNILFILLSAAIISSFALDGTEHMSFLRAAFCTIMMILDAGCIQFVVEDIGVSGIAITVICIIIVLLGMIVFTGAIIGYITNYISDFIANANAGNRKLNVSEHVVILNWNTRASEIINDLMYCDEKRVVVVLTKSRKAEIEQEIYERLTDTVNRENAALKDQKKRFARDYHEKITVIVKEGDVFSSKQLQDISLDQARTVIILGDEQLDDTCGFKQYEKRNDLTKGNTQTVKTLMQVADITASATSFDDQKVIVEITDNWTWDIVSRIKDYKQIKGKCNIIPVRVNKVLGQLLSQFSIMPELNIVYKELLSNKGVAFYYEEFPKTEEDQIAEFLYHHNKVIPLEITENDGKTLLYYAAIHENDLPSEGYDQTSVTVDYNHAYKMDHKHVIILGHNSKIEDIMDGFMAFRTEWADDSEEGVLDVVVIDDENSLERMDHYKRYPFVVKTVAADIYERELICRTIEEFYDSHTEDISILILSDDTVSGGEIDSQALTNLVYVQDIIFQKKKENPAFDENSMDMIVEIIDPKHHDIVNSYSVNNIVISNRYISKMITQIGEKDYLFDFYKDILTYDTDVEAGYESKEIYTKKAEAFFHTLPGRESARHLIQAVYVASGKESKDAAILLGYINKEKEMVLFGGDLDHTMVELKSDDLLIVFCNH